MSKDIIITGIPRSGTSYMCSILNEVKNTVVINEPNEVFQLMHNASDVSLKKYYEVVRERIKHNLPIKNKIVDGKFIEDTNIIDTFSEYMPDVDADDFLLGTKNTLIYLSALEKLKLQFQNATIIACVRHPVDTIASWANVSFPHIRNVEYDFLLDYSNKDGKKAINRVLQKKKLSQRYAMWWDYLAKIIHKNSSNIVIVRYEDMVVDPQATVNKVCESSSFSIEMNSDLVPSSPRSHRAGLDEEVLSSINDYCKNSASKLGYQL